MIRLSRLAEAVQPSATLAAGAKAKRMAAEGIKVYDFSLGEPDFPTPSHICEAAYQAMQEGDTHYTPAPGTAALRNAIAQRYEAMYGLQVAAEQVVVSNGAKHSIHNALSVLCGPGDEVLIPAPYWVSYSALVEMTGASYRLLPTTLDTGFKITPEQLEAAITPQSRVLMLNSPSNPTGVVYTRAELEAIAEVVLENHLAVISDEIYEQLVYGEAEATCFATLRPELRDWTVTISGVSKSYAMTGWRIGWAVAPPHVAAAMSRIQSQQTGCPSSVGQRAALAAITGDQQCVGQMRGQFAVRRDLVKKRLDALGIRCAQPDGAFYAFFEVAPYFGRTLGKVEVTDSMSFCQAALETVHVNLVPGSAFGAEGYVRMSFASSEEDINAGLDRLGELLQG